MTTKLVYVLTCAPDKNYIEQALIAVFSARHWNPTAHIVLIVDDKTDALFVGKRAELLDYVTEKIVVPFEDDGLSPMYRSRWIKTSVRQLVDGDFLFVDCDTICNAPLAEIESFECELAMVPDEHLPVKQYNDLLKAELKEKSQLLGYDVLAEEWYFNSGVILAKDTPKVREFWKRWHSEWLSAEAVGVGIDQPSLGKTNSLLNRPIKHLPPVWNTLVYMNPVFIREAKILHFWQFRNRSFIFGEPFLEYVQANGVDKYVRQCVLSPVDSVLPSYNVLHVDNWSAKLRYIKKTGSALKGYAMQVDSSFSGHPWMERFNKTEVALVRKKRFFMASAFYFSRIVLSALFKGKKERKSVVYFT